MKLVNTAQRGKTIILEHGQDVDTLYGHLGEVLVVSQGEVVSQGANDRKNWKERYGDGALCCILKYGKKEKHG